MPNPKRRHSNSRTNKRRKSRKLAVVGLSICPNCQNLKLPHAVCSYCGYYKGKLVLPPRKEKKEKV